MPINALFIPAILVTLGSLIFGVWAVFVRRSGSVVAGASLAVGVGLSVLVLTIHAMYTWNAFRPMYGGSAPALIAIAVFALVFGAHVAKYNPNSGVIALALLSGLSILCVCGVALWFMVACGNGDCI